MDADKALEYVNAELVAKGHPPLQLTPVQRQVAYNTALEYAHLTQRPIQVALQDVVRHQLQTEELAKLRSQS